MDKCGFRGEDDMNELHIQFGMVTRLVIHDWTSFTIFKEVTLKLCTPKLVYFVIKSHAANVLFLESVPSLLIDYIFLPSLVPVPRNIERKFWYGKLMTLLFQHFRKVKDLRLSISGSS